MDEVQMYEYWETLSIRKGYKMLIEMGVEKSKARWEALKGVQVFVVSPKRK